MKLHLTLLAAWLLILPSANAADVPLSDPDGKPADMTKPVKVFILLGQSNMLGMGDVGPADKLGTLEYMIQKKDKYSYLVDDKGEWTERKDVRYAHVMDKRGVDPKNMDDYADVKNQWLKVTGTFGPELGFGHVMGQVYEEPVLVLKSCIGNRSLRMGFVATR